MRITTNLAARLDALPWTRWHTRVVGALAVTWLLDGLEGSLGGSLAGALQAKTGLGLSSAELGLSSSYYLAGTVAGALVFGYLADRFGRRTLFFWTLGLYLCATAATGLAWSLASFTACRMLTGAGIGGEYAAINSAVDELVPARVRGRVDLWINGTFWLGILLGSGVCVTLLSPAWFGEHLGWRLAFLSGTPIGLVVLWLRRYVPESPRWLLRHGRATEAEAIVEAVERESRGCRPVPASVTIDVTEESTPGALLKILTGAYRQRTLVCLCLMAAQAFFYNSVFFSLALVLLRFYGVAGGRVGLVFVPIAVTNFLGPALLGRLFDNVGRRQMICVTYCVAGAMLLVESGLFWRGALSLTAQVCWWCAIFFFASTAASSAYLTVSEVFPQMVRGSAIAVFYAFGTMAGGVFGPLVFGHLMAAPSRTPIVAGYAAGAMVMMFAGAVAARWGVAAEGRTLEELAPG